MRNNNNSIFYPGYFGPTSRTITESVILLEMTDFKTSKLVWQASLDLREHNKITKKTQWEVPLELVEAREKQRGEERLQLVREEEEARDASERKEEEEGG